MAGFADTTWACVSAGRGRGQPLPRRTGRLRGSKGRGGGSVECVSCWGAYRHLLPWAGPGPVTPFASPKERDKVGNVHGWLPWIPHGLTTRGYYVGLCLRCGGTWAASGVPAAPGAASGGSAAKGAWGGGVGGACELLLGGNMHLQPKRPVTRAMPCCFPCRGPLELQHTALPHFTVLLHSSPPPSLTRLPHSATPCPTACSTAAPPRPQAVSERKAFEDEAAKLRYQVMHLKRAVRELEAKQQ